MLITPPPRLSLVRTAQYPEEKEGEFGGNPWILAKDTKLLDFVGTQLVLISAWPAPQGLYFMSPSQEMLVVSMLVCT